MKKQVGAGCAGLAAMLGVLRFDLNAAGTSKALLMPQRVAQCVADGEEFFNIHGIDENFNARLEQRYQGILQ